MQDNAWTGARGSSITIARKSPFSSAPSALPDRYRSNQHDGSRHRRVKFNRYCGDPVSPSIGDVMFEFRRFFLSAALLALASTTAQAQVVISQVYGGGGNSGSTYTHDFIELFNAGNVAVDLTGWTVQYASSTGNSWAATNLTSVVLQPGQYYLVQEAQGTGGTTPL